MKTLVTIDNTGGVDILWRCVIGVTPYDDDIGIPSYASSYASLLDMHRRRHKFTTISQLQKEMFIW